MPPHPSNDVGESQLQVPILRPKVVAFSSCHTGNFSTWLS
jgi:hypothetical protein